MSLSLNKIFAHAGRDLLIRELSLDSRNVRAGDLFRAGPGGKFEGLGQNADALKRGAAALAYEVEGATVLLSTDVPLIPVRGLAKQLSDMAGRCYGGTSRHVNLGGVTGSNGKTTTKELCADILRRQGPTLATRGNLNNNYGVPLTLLRREAEDVLAIIEMGMNHRGEIATLCKIAEPTIGVLTNVGTAHIE